MLNQLRQQFSSFWGSQGKAQRIMLIVLVGTGLVLVPLFLVWASTPSYAVAFSGLSEADAGTIVEKLTEGAISYQLRGSGTILVPSNQVYEVRLRMAREGLPEGGSVGFELFSSNTLGMTEFTQRVNYQQALEGELERTIGSLNAVEAVRVHVVTPEKSLLSEEQAPTTASITIQEHAGLHLDEAQVRSITHLVASSVEGLQAENVVVVDVNGNLLASGESGGEAGGSAQAGSHRDAELAVARELQAKVQEILDSALGPNKSVVQASVSMNWTERETTIQSYDPRPDAVRSSTLVTETYTTTNGTPAGIPGAATNLPGADTGATSADDGGVSYLRTEATVNYEMAQTEAHEVEAPGKVEKISLSVLVDGVTDAAQLETLQTVIAAAAGIEPSRGDILAVESLAFDRSYYETQAAELEAGSKQDLYLQIGIAVAAALALLALLWYVARLLKNLRLASAQAWTPVLRPVSEMALPLGHSSSAGIQPLQVAGQKPQLPQLEQYLRQEPTPQHSPQHAPQPEPRQISLPKIEIPVLSEEDEQIQSLIRDLADEDPSSLANIIQLWLNEDN